MSSLYLFPVGMTSLECFVHVSELERLSKVKVQMDTKNGTTGGLARMDSDILPMDLGAMFETGWSRWSKIPNRINNTALKNPISVEIKYIFTKSQHLGEKRSGNLCWMPI